MSILKKENDHQSIEELCLFKETFLTYYDALCAYAFSYARNHSVSEDIVQDVFCELWKKRNRIDLSVSLKPLLYRLTKNKSIDHLRKVQLEEEKLNAQETLDYYVRNIIINQEDDFHFNQLRQEISVCIDSLSDQCKNVFILSRFKGLKNKEISEKLNISVKTVEKHISKALLEIRRHLLKKGLLCLIFIFNL